ncbi:hypothetical protein Tco_0883754 [Tanacetum coccineum]
MEECHKLLTDQVDDTIHLYKLQATSTGWLIPGMLPFNRRLLLQQWTGSYLRYGRYRLADRLSILEDEGQLVNNLSPKTKRFYYRCQSMDQKTVISQRVDKTSAGIERYQTQLNLQPNTRWERPLDLVQA